MDPLTAEHLLVNLDSIVVDYEHQLQAVRAELSDVKTQLEAAQLHNTALQRLTSAKHENEKSVTDTIQYELESVRNRLLATEKELFAERCKTERMLVDSVQLHVSQELIYTKDLEIQRLKQEIVDCKVTQEQSGVEMSQLRKQLESHIDRTIELQHKVKDSALATSLVHNTPMSLQVMESAQHDASMLRNRLVEEMSHRKVMEDRMAARDKQVASLEAELFRAQEDNARLRELLAAKESAKSRGSQKGQNNNVTQGYGTTSALVRTPVGSTTDERVELLTQIRTLEEKCRVLEASHDRMYSASHPSSIQQHQQQQSGGSTAQQTGPMTPQSQGTIPQIQLGGGTTTPRNQNPSSYSNSNNTTGPTINELTFSPMHSTGVSISNDRKIATCTSPSQLVMALGNLGASSGKFCFDVIIKTHHPSNCCVAVGVATSSIYTSRSGPMYLYRGDGKVSMEFNMTPETGLPYGRPYGGNGYPFCITCCVDFLSGEISWLQNNHPQGVAFKFSGQLNSLATLYPVVFLKESGDVAIISTSQSQGKK